MSKITCPVIRDLLPLYADDALSEESRALVEEHLETCETCREELEICRKSVQIPPETEVKLLEVLKIRLRQKKVILSLTAVFATALVLFGGFYFLCNFRFAVPYNPETIQITDVSGDIVTFTSPGLGYACITSLGEREVETDGKIERVLYLGFSYTLLDRLVNRTPQGRPEPEETAHNTMGWPGSKYPISRIYYRPSLNSIDFLWWYFEVPSQPQPPSEELPLLWEAEGAPLLFDPPSAEG